MPVCYCRTCNLAELMRSRIWIFLWFAEEERMRSKTFWKRSRCGVKKLDSVHLCCTPEWAEMITIRFAGWISGRIVSLQPDTDIKICFETGTGYGYPIRFTRYFVDSDFWKKLHIAKLFIYYLQKHLFSLLCHDSDSVYAEISVP